MGRQPSMRRFALPFILKNQVTKAEGEVESMDFRVQMWALRTVNSLSAQRGGYSARYSSKPRFSQLKSRYDTTECSNL